MRFARATALDRSSRAVREAVTATVAYCMVTLPPIASMAAPAPSSASASLSGASRVKAPRVGGWSSHSSRVSGRSSQTATAPVRCTRCRPDPVGDLGEQRLVRVQGRPGQLAVEVQQRVRHDPPVHWAGLRHLGRGLEHVVERRDPAAGPGTCAARAAPATGSTQCQAVRRRPVDSPARSVPGLEPRHLDLDAGLPRAAGHPRVGLDAERRPAGRLELSGLLCRCRSRPAGRRVAGLVAMIRSTRAAGFRGRVR